MRLSLATALSPLLLFALLLPAGTAAAGGLRGDDRALHEAAPGEPATATKDINTHDSDKRKWCARKGPGVGVPIHGDYVIG